MENSEEVEMRLGYRGIVLSLFIGLLTACVKPTTPTPPTPTPEPGPSQVWITAPASGAILPLAPVDIKFEGASFTGITEFELRVDGAVQATVSPSGSGSCGANCGTKFFGEYLWTPPDTGDYTIAVRALGNGQYSPVAEIEITIENVTLAEEPPPPLLSTPTSTPLPLLPLEPEKVLVVGLKNGNCREGGGNQYNEVDALMKDQTAEAVAQSEDGLYVKIIGPNWKVECWVWIDLVEVVEGDLKTLKVESYPPDPGLPQPEAPGPAPTATTNPAGRP